MPSSLFRRSGFLPARYHQFWFERSPRSYAKDSHPRFGYIPLADGVTQRAGQTTAMYPAWRLDPQTFPVNMSDSGPYGLPTLPTQLHIYSVNPIFPALAEFSLDMLFE